MKATDFNLQKDLKFDIEKGMTTFKNTRLVMFDANVVGLLRQNLVDLLGVEKARTFFLKFGFQQGYADFMMMKINYEFDSEMDLLASGPVIHTWEGIVHAAPKDLEYDRETGKFFFTGIWSNSYEAEQHLTYNDAASEPVCWSLMGYASGWSTGFFGSPLIAIEPSCKGKGDENCEWKVQPISAWGKEADIYVDAYLEFMEVK
jgi:hypothetical protein